MSVHRTASHPPVAFQFADISEFLGLARTIHDRLDRIEDTLIKLFEDKCETREGVGEQQLKEEIKKYFSDRDGESIFPSEIACELSIDYDLTLRLMDELEAAGQIRKT